MEKSHLQFGDSSIEIHHQGAHLSSWICQGEEQLFLSRKAIFKPAKAIRGGVPLCFPQFGAFGPGQQHGFARNMLWQKRDTDQQNGLSFELRHDKDSLIIWPYKFNARFDLELTSNALSMTLQVENQSDKAAKFTAALHSYFHVDEIEKTHIEGLNFCEYWDNGTDFSQRKHQEESDLTINEMIDRVYFNTQKPLKLSQASSTRQIESKGFVDTVVWNPWEDGAEAFIDMASDEYKQMLCIESANVQTPVSLSAGETWKGRQKITIVER